MRNLILPILILIWALFASWYWTTFQRSEEICCTKISPLPSNDTLYKRDTIYIRDIINCPSKIEIFFDHKSSELSDSALAKISHCFDNNKLDGDTVEIVGHASKIGDFLYNINLSERRAKNVKDYLLRRYNLDSNRVEIFAKGYTSQLYHDISKNRRVDIIFK